MAEDTWKITDSVIFFSVCGRRPWVLCVKTNQLQIRTDSSLLYTVLSVYAETDGLQLQQCDI